MGTERLKDSIEKPMQQIKSRTATLARLQVRSASRPRRTAACPRHARRNECAGRRRLLPRSPLCHRSRFVVCHVAPRWRASCFGALCATARSPAAFARRWRQAPKKLPRFDLQSTVTASSFAIATLPLDTISTLPFHTTTTLCKAAYTLQELNLLLEGESLDGIKVVDEQRANVQKASGHQGDCRKRPCPNYSPSHRSSTPSTSTIAGAGSDCQQQPADAR